MPRVVLNANAQKWIEAMKSGRFKKADGELNSGSGEYCALGVAMKVAEENGVVLPKGAWQRGSLPENVKDWLGLRDNFGTFHDGSRQTELEIDGISVADITDINDSTDFGLRRMGTFIQKNAARLFAPGKFSLAKEIAQNSGSQVRDMFQRSGRRIHLHNRV